MGSKRRKNGQTTKWIKTTKANYFFSPNYWDPIVDLAIGAISAVGGPEKANLPTRESREPNGPPVRDPSSHALLPRTFKKEMDWGELCHPASCIIMLLLLCEEEA